MFLRLEVRGHYFEFGRMRDESQEPPLPPPPDYVPPPMEVHVGFQPALAQLAEEDD